MAIKFCLLFFPLQLLNFRVVITYFGTPQIAKDHTICQKFSREHALGSPTDSEITQSYGATNIPAMLLSF